MKIAIHSCFFSSGESATAQSYMTAGKNRGYDVREFHNAQAIEAFKPDFVINFNYLFPKLTRFPTYAAIPVPLETVPDFFTPNLLTFDGHVSSTGKKIQSYAADLCLSMDKAPPVFIVPGHYTLDFDFPLNGLRGAQLIYCGHNWDKRYLELLELLSKHEWFSVYGLPERWKDTKVTYRGAIPYDNYSLLNAYRQTGVGLSLQNNAFVDYDIVSNRIFEITAAGAVAIVQRMPFIEEHFGDSVLYIDHTKPEKDIYIDVVAHMDWVRNNPEKAAEKAKRANLILKDKFSAEQMLDKLIDYHHASMKQGGWSLTLPKEDQPEVAVIVRAGGRSIEFLRRSFDSLKNQIYQNVRPILVLYKKLDYLKEFLEEYRSSFPKIDIVECLDGIRSTTLWAGLNHIYDQKIPYFCILDDDDEFFPNHISNLFETLQRETQKGGNAEWAYSLWLAEHKDEEFIYCAIKENRKFYAYAPFAKSIEEEIGALATLSVLIKTSLLDKEILQDPCMHTAEDSYLWQHLFSKSLPIPSFRATALQHIHGNNSNFATHPDRNFDLLKLKTRFLGDRKPNGFFWANDINIEKPQKPDFNPKSNQNKVLRVLKILKKIIIRGPSFIKRVLLKIEQM
ncbi:MAG: glycosyltransferase [Alphaproteobacteria bacterium]|nr:glycosyltransferase [Alphaproteobacteria bacterium]